MSPQPAASATSISAVPLHWTAEQALAVFEALHAMRHALWVVYGSQVQQAWRDQLVPEGPMPDFDPHEPF